MSGHNDHRLAVPPHKQYLPGGHAPFDYSKLADLSELRNALTDIHGDIESAIDAIDQSRQAETVTSHMRAAMILSGLEIKMTNFARSLRERFLG